MVEGPAFELDVTAPYASADVVLTGAPGIGENWSLILNGVPYVYAVQFGDLLTGDPLENVANGIVALLNTTAEFTASVMGGNTIRINTAPTVLFDLSFAVLGTTAPSAFIASSTTAINVTLSGTPSEGDRWVLVVDATLYEHTVGIDESLESVVAELAALVDAGAGLDAASDDAQVRISGASTVQFRHAGPAPTDPLEAARGASVSGTTAPVVLEAAPLSEPAWLEED